MVSWILVWHAASEVHSMSWLSHRDIYWLNFLSVRSTTLFSVLQFSFKIPNIRDYYFFPFAVSEFNSVVSPKFYIFCWSSIGVLLFAFYWRRVSNSSQLFQPYYVAKDSLELLTLLPLTPESWGYTHATTPSSGILQFLYFSFFINLGIHFLSQLHISLLLVPQLHFPIYPFFSPPKRRRKMNLSFNLLWYIKSL